MLLYNIFLKAFEDEEWIDVRYCFQSHLTASEALPSLRVMSIGGCQYSNMLSVERVNENLEEIHCGLDHGPSWYLLSQKIIQNMREVVPALMVQAKSKAKKTSSVSVSHCFYLFKMDLFYY